MKSQNLDLEEDDSVSPSEFAFATARIAAAQICWSVGFRATQRSALETLTDVAARYIRTLAESAASSASFSGRTQSNLYDVVRALEDLGSAQGFRGASNVYQPLLSSSTLSDLAAFVRYTDEIPFAKPIRRCCPPKQSVAPPQDFPNSAPSMRFSHIPWWLPAVPKTIEEENRSSIDSTGIGPCGKVDGFCLVGEKMGADLSGKRPRVRFKMGVGGKERTGEGFRANLRNMVCKGGKRVFCKTEIRNGIEDPEKKNCISSQENYK